MIAWIAIFSFVLPSNARTDRERAFATELPGWTIAAVHTDTGELRACTASGNFHGLKVRVGNALRGITGEISFDFAKEGGVRVSQGQIKKASLVANGQLIASASENLFYNVDLSTHPPTLNGYKIWFQNVPLLEEKLGHANHIALVVNSPYLKSVALDEANLPKLMVELRRCRTN